MELGIPKVGIAFASRLMCAGCGFLPIFVLDLDKSISPSRVAVIELDS